MNEIDTSIQKDKGLNDVYYRPHCLAKWGRFCCSQACVILSAIFVWNPGPYTSMKTARATNLIGTSNQKDQFENERINSIKPVNIRPHLMTN